MYECCYLFIHDHTTIAQADMSEISETENMRDMRNVRDIRNVSIDMNDGKGVMSISKHHAVLQQQESDFNQYATNKSYSQELLNFSTFQQQLGFIISMFVSKSTPITPIEIIFIVFVGISIIIEIIMFVLMSILAKAKTEQCTKNCTATSVNNIVTILSFLSAACNFVTMAVFTAITVEKNNSTSSG